MHVAPWRMRCVCVYVNSVSGVKGCLPLASHRDAMCFKECISGCALKSSGVWEATLAFTSRLPPRGSLNGVTTYYITHTRLTCRLILFVFCGMTRKFTLFVSRCNCRKFSLSRRRRIRLMHMAPWRMRCKMCFKGCISGCAVKSSGVWEATLAFTSRLPPRGSLNSVTTYNIIHKRPT